MARQGLFLILLSICIVRTVDAHGAMNLPRERNTGADSPGGTMNQGGCEGHACMWFNQGCTIGCPACDDTFNNFANFSSACGLKKAPVTLPHKFRTIKNYEGFFDFTSHHPWRAPGSAPVMDSCGVSGGSFVNNDRAGGIGNATIAHKQGVRGSGLQKLGGNFTLTWIAGEEAEVSWGVSANHGGGYQYRLCPAGEALTEACFQKTPLAFSGTKSWLRWTNGDQVEIDATSVTEGTTPAGSEWRKNPIPTCGPNMGTGGFAKKSQSCSPPQFPPPPGCNETCWGYVVTPGKSGQTTEIPAIVDKVIVPKDLPPGGYVVGWRWDCEQTPQVWAGCGDIIVVAPTKKIVSMVKATVLV